MATKVDYRMQKKMRELLEYCKKKVDYVIIDSPPVGHLGDAEVLAEEAGAVLLVAKQNMMLAEDINEILDRFMADMANIRMRKEEGINKMSEYRENTNEPERINLMYILNDVIKGLRKLWLVIVALMVIFALKSFLTVNYSYMPQYVASATMAFSSAQRDLGGVSEDVSKQMVEPGTNFFTVSASAGDVQALSESGIDILGYVFNDDMSTRSGGYGYGYSYGYKNYSSYYGSDSNKRKSDSSGRVFKD